VTIDNVEIGDHAENALLLRELNLFGGDLIGRIGHRYGGQGIGDFESGTRQDYEVPWLHDDGGRDPICESLGIDADVIGPWIDIVEFKEAVVIRDRRARISEGRAFENNIGPGNDAVVGVDHSVGDTSLLRLWDAKVLSRQRRGQRNRRQDQKAYSWGSHQSASLGGTWRNGNC
jgi:hypothetical protein